MLIVLGLLSLEEVGFALGAVLVALWWLLVVMPLKYFLALVVKLCFLLGLVYGAGCLFAPRPSARDDVHESWDEVQDLGVVGEGQVVGEPRRLEHALIAKVWLGSLGTLSLTLEPASRHR